MARSGFYYTGVGDCVECFCCRGQLKGLKSGDNVEQEHERLYPHCGYLPSRRNAYRVDDGTTNKQTSSSSSSSVLKICYPKFADLHERRRTFARWKIPAAGRIAEAGFFAIDVEAGRAACYNCAVVLDFRSTDERCDPLFEHARFYPFCDLLIQTKGTAYVEYVRNATERAVEKKCDVKPVPELFEALSLHVSSEGANKVHSSGLCKIDGWKEKEKEEDEEEEEEKKKGDVWKNKTTSAITVACLLEEEMKRKPIQQVVEMGYTIDTVENVVLQKLKEGKHFDSVVQLFDAVTTQLAQKEDGEKSAEVVAKPPAHASDSKDKSIVDLRSKVTQLLDQRLCKVCMEQDSNVCFLPCGHISACESCGRQLSECPICRGVIDTQKKVFLA
ncbi:baculoviral IAP repeat-containing protein 7-A-like [Antedon mediterranea]|uniref:baculoviral IAP repeat-containing protein 7-A-like n=1 Tax=Antedon mediterranea TaxID=105859 RepID=UPI003AF8FC50